MYNTQKLKLLRKEKGLTIYDMAKQLAITPSFYSQIETKKRRLFYDTAVRICTVINVRPDQVFYSNTKSS